MRRGGMTSITAQLRRSVGTIALLLTVPAVIGLVMMILYSSRTQAMIRRMDSAAEMKPALENTIAENLFSVAAGRCSFRESGVFLSGASLPSELEATFFQSGRLIKRIRTRAVCIIPITRYP